MSETTQEERDEARRFCTIPISFIRDADRLAAIERQVIYRTADMPADAVAWHKNEDGTCHWTILFGAMNIRTYTRLVYDDGRSTAPDLRSDEPGPLFLPIIDALDAGGEDG